MDPTLRLEGDLALARQSLSGAFPYPIMALVVGLGTPLGQDHPTMMQGLFVGYLGLAVARLLVAQRLLKSPPDEMGRWKRPLQTTILIQGLLWGLLSALAVILYGGSWTGLLVLLILAGMGSSGSLSLTPDLATMRFFLAVLVAPAVLASAWIGNSVLAVVVTVYGLQLLVQGGKQSQWFWKALRDNLELSRQSVQLEQARLEAVAGSQAKSAFLSVMSHEIRTPLNGVIGMTSLLSDTEMNDEQTEYTSVIRSSGEALLSVINDVLDFSKIEAGHLDLEHLDFDLRASLEDVAELLALKAQEKGLEFPLIIRQELPERVKGDPSRFRQILLNLVNNAIKFTEQGEVSVTVGLEAAHPDGSTVVRVDVSDTGVGIPADRQAALFQPFVQADASTSRRFGGTGLGLAISKRLVDVQGGTIWLESTPGQGSTFSFTIPFEPAETTVALELPMVDIEGLKVLVVDDNATNRQVFREQLKAWSCQVVEAADPATVLETLVQAANQATPFDLALLDFQMPGMDGLQLAAQIRAQPGVSETPLILMTSAPQRGDAKKSTLCRLDGYLTKPVRRKALLGLLGAIRGSNATTRGALPLITAHTLRENPAARKIRVLVAEDNLVNQKLLSRMLEKAGYACDIAANGLEVLVAMQRIGYDIILMDRQMPELDGAEATQRIRSSQQRWSKVPIVAVSAGVSLEERQACLAAGMDDFLSKPVDRVELVKMLKKYAPERPWGIQPQIPDLDANQLTEVCAGDQEFQQEMVTTFLKELEQFLTELDGAGEAQDAPRIRRAAHSLKGASRYIGALRLAKVSEQMEKSAADGDLEAVASLTPTMLETAQVLQSILAPTTGPAVPDPVAG